jgi:hypothetical protein
MWRMTFRQTMRSFVNEQEAATAVQATGVATEKTGARRWKTYQKITQSATVLQSKRMTEASAVAVAWA